MVEAQTCLAATALILYCICQSATMVLLLPCAFCVLLVVGHGYGSITEPCGGVARPKRASLNHWFSNLFKVSSSKREVRWSVTSAIASVEHLVSKYTDESSASVRITSEDAKYYDTWQPLENFTSTRKTYEYHNRAEMIQDDFNNVATMMVFMNVVHDDEVSHENEMDTEMWELVVDLNRVLCRLDILADRIKASLDKTIKPQVPLIYQNLSLADQYIRDYLVFRDAKLYMKSMVKDY